MEKKPPYNAFLKYTNQAIQMILVMVAGTLGGKYADAYFKNDFPILTLIGVIFSVFAALYLAIKDFLKK
ncbi:MAG: AtpZ/AtpI family protein [Bacteroidia bacterium]|nr:AtpZ/AtpI family protein [Bacteroidota bacterium]